MAMYVIILMVVVYSMVSRLFGGGWVEDMVWVVIVSCCFGYVFPRLPCLPSIYVFTWTSDNKMND
jgi:hypothetical protein